jgi:hypothetical protein
MELLSASWQPCLLLSPPALNSHVLIELFLCNFWNGELRPLEVGWIIKQRLFPRLISQRGHQMREELKVTRRPQRATPTGTYPTLGAH